MAFHAFKDGEGEHGSFEVFHVHHRSPEQERGEMTSDVMSTGWYWWACFPGCLPDGEPSGPFNTEQEAHDDAIGGDWQTSAP